GCPAGLANRPRGEKKESAAVPASMLGGKGKTSTSGTPSAPALNPPAKKLWPGSTGTRPLEADGKPGASYGTTVSSCPFDRQFGTPTNAPVSEPPPFSASPLRTRLRPNSATGNGPEPSNAPMSQSAPTGGGRAGCGGRGGVQNESGHRAGGI